MTFFKFKHPIKRAITYEPHFGFWNLENLMPLYAWPPRSFKFLPRCHIEKSIVKSNPDDHFYLEIFYMFQNS